MRFSSIAFLLIGASVWAPGAAAQNAGEWLAYGGDNRAAKYSPLDQIDARNVHDLKIAWRWRSTDQEIWKAHSDLAAGEFQATPIMIGGVLYTSTAMSQVAAIDPATGKTIWVFNPETWRVKMPTTKGFQHRGVAYWSDGKQGRIMIATGDSKLIALDAKTGTRIASFGDNGVVDLRVVGLVRQVSGPPLLYGHTSAVVVSNGVLVVGSYISDRAFDRFSPPGDVRGFDVRTGKLLWVFHTVPQEGEFGTGTWENESWKYTGAANVWAPISADDELGYVYLPVSTPTNNFSGVDRPGSGLFGDSLVCLNVKTGQRVWHFQFVHHGLWDYDTPAAPNLVDITVGGKRIKAVAQVTKQGFTYVFNRVTGEPVWPIEERPVPQSTRPGEKSWPTQPFPTKPPAFDLQGVTEDDLINFTPELRAEALEILKRYKYGPLFTPPDAKIPTIFMPGWLGGANWFGAAADPETGMLYVPSATAPLAYPLRAAAAGAGDNDNIAAAGGFLGGPRGLPLFKPPFSRVTAIDLNRGEIAWTAPLGDGPRDHPALKDLHVAPLGTPYARGRALLTKTLLFVVETDAREPRGPSTLHAFDKQTGKEIGRIPLTNTVMDVPMTYQAGSKQYIVVGCGARTAPHELIALSLP